MVRLEALRDEMTRLLTAAGVRAVNAWPQQARKRPVSPVVAVSLRDCEGGPGGMQDYLGQRYNEETACWEELFGKRARLTFGLDIRATKAETCQAAADELCTALAGLAPAGLVVRQFSCGEVTYREDEGLFLCAAEAGCEAFLYAVADDEGSFLDFEVRGGMRQ